MFRFAEKHQIFPLVAPVAFTSDTTVVASPYVKMNGAQWASFLIPLGAAASDTALITITVECSTAAASNATEVPVGFRYRLSNAIGGTGWGAIGTAAATDGYALNGLDDNKVLLIEVDPAALPAAQPDGNFIRVVTTFDQSDGIAGVFGGVFAVLEPRYPGNSIPSAT